MEIHSLNRKWMVLFAAFFGNFCSVGLIGNMSVLYVEWLEAFGQSAAETALVQSMCTGIMSISGVILGMLLSRFGVRVVGMVSGLLHALGFILSFFAPNLIYLTFILSIAAGLGTSGIYLASMTAVQEYFGGKQRVASLSVASVGSGVGGTVFTYLMNYLSLQYGWKGCMLIVGGILLHTVPLFAICRPINNQNSSINTNTKVFKQENGESASGNMHWLTKTLRDFKQIIKVKIFLINMLGLIILPAIISPLIILVDYLQEKGFSRQEAVLSYMVITIFSCICRLAPAVLKCIPHMSIFGIALLTSAIGTASLLALPSVHSFSWNILAMCCVGFCHGAVFGGILPISVSKTVSQQYFSQALGITMTAIGIIVVLAGPFIGYLRDITGSYDAVFYATGSCGCLSIFMYIIALRLKWNYNQLKSSSSDDRKECKEKNTSMNTYDRKQSEKGNISIVSIDRKQFGEDKTTTNAYEDLSLETHL